MDQMGYPFGGLIDQKLWLILIIQNKCHQISAMANRIISITPRRRAAIVFNGGLMFALGLVAGLLFTFALIGRVEAWPLLPALDITIPGSVQAWRQTHIGILFNAITLFAIAAVGKSILLTDRVQNLLVVCVLLTGWFNIAGFVTGTLFGARGLAMGGDLANSVTYIFFLVAVVTAIVQATLIVVGAFRGMRTIGLG